MRNWIAFAVWLLVGSVIALPVSAKIEGVSQTAEVLEVIDGDGVYLCFYSDNSCGTGLSYRANLMAVDAPEYSERGSRKTECFGKEAKIFLENLVLKKKVVVEWDSHETSTKHNGHYLVYLKIGNVDVNAEMIRTGHAIVPWQFAADRDEEYSLLQVEAMRERLGAWTPKSTGGCIPEIGSKN